MPPSIRKQMLALSNAKTVSKATFYALSEQLRSCSGTEGLSRGTSHFCYNTGDFRWLLLVKVDTSISIGTGEFMTVIGR